ncbi:MULTISPECIES: hypothetical protein [Corynebacterium]|uniref:Secreted protein n=1 Tax=Corynebacterium aurimucosum TaxID=169292 RepID=A0A2N6TLB4_9CORY|nr:MULTISPECIES: hypothetical protein [Corynebacterium]OFN74385.1 hypothetical protein HMPREF2526_04030 [Corynebacterium sp. HMSC070E08]OFO20844.1 hypothetical protein HMPREF3056_09120 [Corynebacterium sp. HMSC056F09]OFO96699.1 hypothetical protein HMPREF3009_05120 [Corynebacterium sp. HMSC034H07]OFP29619.1 hypothetical protein HMPREF2993_09780 [Corynebacterium sp. HMSC068G04]OFQ55019.1 hypothetical protein HMPREF2932_11445 [Corynebacterium sp. HMSC074H12]
MKKLVTAAAALAVAASGLVACNDKKEEVDMKPSSEMMAPSSDAMESDSMMTEEMKSDEMMAPSEEMTK